ncbi:MAG: hypothetical protein OEM39_04630 [Acidimicrobiia bacterium]|nr:hypothetical protein [Acidimicrobiia bacterium]MDH3462049.1 hypothetical protein [Acidimicrobiia bacterium]
MRSDGTFNIYRYTRLGRSLGLGNPQHRLALVGASVAGLIGLAVEWTFRGQPDVVSAFLVGVSAFLAWALGRELDPDREVTALWSLVLAVPLAIWERPSAIMITIALIGLRVLIGTVGHGLRPIDHLAIIAGAGYAGMSPEGWMIVLLLVVGLLASRERLYIATSIGAIGAAVLSALLLGEHEVAGSDSPAALVGWAAVVLVAAGLSTRVMSVSSTTDVGNVRISLSRLRLGRGISGLVIVGALLLSPTHPGAVLGPWLAALVATALFASFGRTARNQKIGPNS